MLKLDFTYPDFTQYGEHIGITGNINYINAIKYEQTILGYSARSDTLAGLLNNKFYYLSKFNCGGKMNDELVRTEFIRLGIPTKLYHSYKNKSGYSLDKGVRTEVIQWIENQENVTLDLYVLYRFLVIANEKSESDAIISSCSSAKRKGLLENSELKGWNNSPLYIMHNIYYQQVTGRYYAREMPIVGLPKVIRNCFTVPARYFLMSMDLRQIDISCGYDMYLRGSLPEYDKIFDDEPEDKYLAMYKIVCLQSSMSSDTDYFTEFRADIKTNILAGLYQGQLNTLNQTLHNNELNSAIVNYYESNENYQAQVRKIEALYDLGILFTIQDAFGFRMDINPEDDSRNIKDLNKVARDCISYVTQSTSNSIKVKWLNEVMSRLRENGASEYDIWACMDRHDEVAFTVSIDALQHMKIFKECEVIRIANWGNVRFKTTISLHSEDKPTTWSNEAELLDDINNRINEAVKGFTPTVYQPEASYVFKGIPTVHDVYLYSTDLPIALYYSLFGEEFVPSDVFIPESEKQQECAEHLAKKAQQMLNTSNYSSYPSTWNKFILRNSNSGKEFGVPTLNSLPNVLERFNIEYVRIHTVYGEGLCSLGNCYGIKDTLNSYEVVSKLLTYEC